MKYYKKYIFYKAHAYYINIEYKSNGGFYMGLLLIILGIFLTTLTFFKLSLNIFKNKNYSRKTAKIVGFESFVYPERKSEFNILYNPTVYPILEVEDKNEKIKLVMPVCEDSQQYEEGKEVEIMYPKGKIDKSKIYNYNNELKFYYATLVVGLIITIVSFSII
jgi:hypothetical protein